MILPKASEKGGKGKEEAATFRNTHVFCVLHDVKAGERISPFPLSSILKTSRTDDFSRFRIRHVPSWFTIVWSPG